MCVPNFFLFKFNQPDALAAEAWRNDARNPYAAQIARESIH